MILTSDYFNKRLIENTIEKLNTFAREADKKGISRELGLVDSVAAKIIEFEVKPFIAENELIGLEVLREQLTTLAAQTKSEGVIEDVLERIEIENRHAFEITVRTLSPTIIGYIQKALVTYLHDNEYIKKRIESNQISLRARREKLINDLGEMDSLKGIIYANYKSMAVQQRQGSNNVILSDKSVTNPVEIYEQDLIIYNQLQVVDEQLRLQRDFEVVEGFTEFTEPATPGLFRTVFYSLLLGIVVAYLDVALRALNRYLISLN
jgi:hypothetical protein